MSDGRSVRYLEDKEQYRYLSVLKGREMKSTMKTLMNKEYCK